MICPAGMGPEGFFRLWDLMNHFNAYNLALRAANFTAAEANFRRYSETGRAAVASAVEMFISELGFAADDLYASGMQSASNEMRRVLRTVQCEQKHPSALEVLAQGVGHRVLQELRRRRFLRIANGRRQYLDQQHLFGHIVSDRFPNAVGDIRAAGNCLAAECDTAAVFHLMRVAEHGLRAVAKKLRVKLKHKGQNQPIEYADWNDVIVGIKNQITEARKLSRGPKKEAALQFYSDIADQCEYMKDIWRNTIAHTRRPYSGPEAIAVTDRVKAFMVRLASELLG